MQLSVTRETAKTIAPLLPATDSVEGETAQALSSSAVKTRLQRARFLLRRSLNKYFESHARRELEGLASAEWAGAGRFRYVDC
jgi:hypothetical protein